MNVLENTLFPVFVRKCLQTFSVKDLMREFGEMGMKIEANELEILLESEPNVISLENRKYITHAGAFTGQLFSFIPTEKEVSQGVIVLGDRGIPFLDSEMFYFEVNITVNGRLLNKKAFESDCNVVRDIFYLHDDEITDQIIAKDPINLDLHLAERNFELPYNFSLSGFDVSFLFDEVDFKYGDRIIAYVSDWDAGTIEILPLKCIDTTSIPGLEFLREKWYEILENGLLESFERDGACSGIDSQLANVFFDNKDCLCNISCGSVSEFLEKSKKVSLEYFGVESRLWKRGEEVPAKIDGEFGSLIGLFYTVSDLVIDSFVKDLFFRNKKVVDLDDEFICTILSENMDLPFAEREFLSLQIENRHDKLRKSYNWFADFAFGALRQRAIKFFIELRDLYFELDCMESELPKFPQGELIAVVQFFSQTVEILENIEMNCCAEFTDTTVEEWSNVMNLAVEGMEVQLDYIKPILFDAFEQIKKERFSVV